MCIQARVPSGTDWGFCNAEDDNWVGPAGIGFLRTEATAERAEGWLSLSMIRDGVSNAFAVEVYWTDYQGAGQAPPESRTELARREYDEEFVEAGRTDSFVVPFDGVDYTIDVGRKASSDQGLADVAP